jgi:hypothetical protein
MVEPKKTNFLPGEMETLKEREFKRELGTDLLDTLSKNVAASPIQAVEELVANSYDGDAGIVRVTYVPEETLIVRDDGVGMTPDDVVNFYRVGDSVKKGSEMTALGRVPLGSFGIATLAIRTLGESYGLETTRDGKRTRGGETFDQELGLEKTLRAVITEVPKDTASGTVITIHGLKFTGRTAFTEDELAAHLADSMPIEDPKGFKIMVNNKQVSSKAIENATRFEIDSSGEHMGHIEGTLYLTGNTTPRAGIHIKVNGRRIGDPKNLIDMAAIKHSLVNRVVAVVNADDLAPYIRSDRGGFNPSEAYEELCSTLVDKLKEVRRFASQRTESKRGKVIQSKTSAVMKEILARARARGVPEFSEKGYKLKMSDDLETTGPGEVYVAERTVVLNANYPSLSPDLFKGSKAYSAAMEGALVELLAAHRTDLRKTQKYWGNKNDLFRAFHPPKVQKAKTTEERIFQSMLYTLADLSHSCDFTLPEVRYLTEGGVLQVNGNNEVLGSDFLEMERELHPFVPLPGFLKKFYSGSSPFERYKTRVEAFLGEMGEGIQPFVFNRGNGEGPCYVFEPSTMAEVYQALGNLDKRRVSFDPANAARELFERPLSPRDISKLLGLPAKKMDRTVKYAENEGLDVGEERMRNMGTVYRLGPFLVAHQAARSKDYLADLEFRESLLQA